MNPISHIHSLHVYPVKSCAGFSPGEVLLTATGLAHDREWMVVDPNGRFITQREAPRLALVCTAIAAGALQLTAPNLGGVAVAVDHGGVLSEVGVWRSRVPAFDAGEAAAGFFSTWLGRPARLVRFDARHQRLSNRDRTGPIRAPNLFSDGYPLMVLSEASLQDLNRRMGRELPMNRFRPNIVLGGVEAYAEDVLQEIEAEGVRLRPVKPCTRCVITTTDQATGLRDGDEPLQTLRRYKYDAALHGVVFGQNMVMRLTAPAASLRRGQPLVLR